jgi:hypothetical protein
VQRKRSDERGRRNRTSVSSSRSDLIQAPQRARLRALHTYIATTPPPPQSSEMRCNGRWDQQHDGVVLMVESICGQGFAYAREVEEES